MSKKSQTDKDCIEYDEVCHMEINSRYLNWDNYKKFLPLNRIVAALWKNLPYAIVCNVQMPILRVEWYSDLRDTYLLNPIVYPSHNLS